MKRVISVILCVLLLLFAVSAAASAEEAPGIISAVYLQNHTLRAFIQSDDAELMSRATITLDDGKSIQETWASPKTVGDSDITVSYLLVIDDSDDMPEYRQQILDLAGAICQHEKCSFTVTIATMGERFEVKDRNKNITSLEAIEAAINELGFEQHLSQICDGLLDAIEYLKTECPPVNGELQNIVLITNGDPYLDGSGRSWDAIDMVAQSTKEIVEKSTEYLIHTVSFARWNSTTFNAVSVSPGLDFYPNWGYNFSTNSGNEPTAATRVGRVITSYVDSLYKVDIRYTRRDNWTRFDGQLVVNTHVEGVSVFIPVSSIRNMDVKDSFRIPHFDDEGNLIEESPTELEPTEITDPTEQPDPDSPTLDPSSAHSENTEAPATVDEPDGGSGTILGMPWWAFVLILIGVAIVVILLLVFIGNTKHKKRMDARRAQRDAAAQSVPASAALAGAKTPASAPSGNYITVIPQILYGSAHCASTELKLYNELIIGTAADCDIVIEDTIAAAHNTRVFFENGMIYIEDLNETSCTYVAGMKIFSKNRLRSGDEIMVGDTALKLRF